MNPNPYFCGFIPAVSTSTSFQNSSTSSIEITAPICPTTTPFHRHRSNLSLHPHSSSHCVLFCSSSQTPSDDDITFDEIAARVAEIKEVIEGLESFKERIITDATKLAKKVKTPPKKLQEALDNHPDINKINESIKQLNVELAQLQSNS